MITIPEMLTMICEEIYFVPFYKYRFIRCQMYRIAEKILTDGDIPFQILCKGELKMSNQNPIESYIVERIKELEIINSKHVY